MKLVHFQNSNGVPMKSAVATSSGDSLSSFNRAKWPHCPNGHGAMSFYGQLDSINDDLCLGDCGMIYVFFCFDCFESTSLLQSS